MPYDFETLVDRSRSGSVKWNNMREADPDLPAGIVPLSIGDMELKTPPELVAGLKDFLDGTILGYTSPIPAYFRAITDWFRRRHGWEVAEDWILSYDGVVPALYAAVSAFTGPGDGVIYMPPVYRPLYYAIDDSRRQPVAVPLRLGPDGYTMDFDLLEKTASNPEVKLLLFCSPHNPVSRVWRRDELERLGHICLKHDVLVVSDEIHMDFVLPGHKHLVYTEMDPKFAERAIVCTAPSKTFNIAGLQVSNIIIPNSDIRRRFHDEHLGGGRFEANQLGLEACRIAYERCEPWLVELLNHIRENGEMVRRFMHEHFAGVRVFDLEGTYFLWLDFRIWKLDARKLERHMVKKARLFLDEGYIFGEEGNGFERINLACPRWVLSRALERLREAGMPG